MNKIAKQLGIAAFAALVTAAQAAPKTDYVYTPAAGVHEVKYFHGCYDGTDIEKRPKIDVIMNGLSTDDVVIETRVIEEGKPSTEMVTYRMKTMDASLKVQFRSNDGPHCQQGVRSVNFKNAVLRHQQDLAAHR